MMIEVYLSPKKFHIEPPNPRAKYKNWLVCFSEGPSRVLIKLTEEQYESFKESVNNGGVGTQ